MRPLTAGIILFLFAAANVMSEWTFTEGTVTVSSRSAGDVTETFSPSERVKKTLNLGYQNTLKLAAKIQDDAEAKRPHQAFLMLRSSSGLEAPFPLAVKGDGKAALQIAQRNIPIQLLLASQPLEASLILGSFGASKGSVSSIFDINMEVETGNQAPRFEKPVRYGPLPEIHHIFRSDPKTLPKIVSLLFSVAVMASIPALAVSWFLLGANLSDLQKALSSAPVSHVTFFGSIVAMEGVFVLYHRSWTLFQTLPAIGLVGAATFFSGTKALGEVQRRRSASEK